MKSQIKIKITSSWKMEVVAKIRADLGVPFPSPSSNFSKGSSPTPLALHRFPGLALVILGNTARASSNFQTNDTMGKKSTTGPIELGY